METDVTIDPVVADQAEVAPSSPEKSDKEINFERLRKEKERLERETKEKDAKIQELQSIKEAISIGDDDLVDGKQFKSVAEKQAALEQKQRALEMELQVERAINKYPDIAKVVTEENLAKLKEIEPELHANLQNKDVYLSWVNAYKHIKAYVLKPEKKIEQERIEENLQRSPSIQKAGGSSSIKEDMLAGPLTPELKELLLANRKRAVRRITKGIR